MVDATTAATTPQRPAATLAGSSGSTAAISSDFETFLKMLTAQLENQDPLNPLDSTDFAVQLATFSGVEQQVQTNDLLSALTARMTASGMADMAGWVGMDARAAAPVRYDGSAPITLSPNPLAIADRAELIVRDAWGTEVRRIPIPATADNIDWDGTMGEGAPLPSGTYSFELTSYSEGDPVRTDPVEAYQPVTEIRAGANGTILLLQSGAQVLAEAVTALREPG